MVRGLTIRLLSLSNPRAIAQALARPPMYGDLHEPEYEAHVLLQRLLNAGLSRYEPDPIGALERVAAAQ
jgi:hypothetical protein